MPAACPGPPDNAGAAGDQGGPSETAGTPERDWTVADVIRGRAGFLGDTPEIFLSRAESLDDLPEVYYEYYVLDQGGGNDILARNAFYKRIGNGDVSKGRERALTVEAINRRRMHRVGVGDTLSVPTAFDLDFRAYAPFPRYYTGGKEVDMLIVIDKTIESLAIYEFGVLALFIPLEQVTAPNGRYVERGTTVIVLGRTRADGPDLFALKVRYPVLKRVELPADPKDVPRGPSTRKVLPALRPWQGS